jgi:2-dehydropantoate 2-reductase
MALLTVYGPGSVGLVIGARLARAGEQVLFVSRSADVVDRIEREGVSIEDPATSRTFTARAHSSAGVDAAAARIGEGPVLICTRSADTLQAARELADVVPDAVVASAQNGVDNDGLLADHFRRVQGVVVRQTCTRTADNAARATGPGRLVVGSWPGGCDEPARDLAHRFRRAGYDVGLSHDLAADRWLKLCVNLMSAPNALIRREDHATTAFVEIKVRLLEEARDAILAAGLTVGSCDGRDRALDDEIEHQRGALARGDSARDLPLYNDVWSCLKRNLAPDALRYHEVILDLAFRHGLRAPLNARVLDALRSAGAKRSGPESMGARELLGTSP